MTTATDLLPGPVVMTAPIAGRVRLHPPRDLCGELEIFRAHETIATVTDENRIERVQAPAAGFLRRVYVIDGAVVEPDSPLLLFSVTG